MADSAIEWTDATWNPVAGCTVISPGCTNCYAMRMAARLDAMGTSKYKGLTRKSGRKAVWVGKVRLDRHGLDAPLSWRKPRMVFVNSMSDLFHESVPFDFIASVWDVMQRASHHTFQVLTKRPERMTELTADLPTLANVWLGTTIENEEYLWRLDLLRSARAMTRFVSFEPLIGSVRSADLSEIDWAIVGGESGPNCRPMDPKWVEEIRRSCGKSGTAFFFKQWGGSNKKAAGRLLHGKTWDEFPVRSISAGQP